MPCRCCVPNCRGNYEKNGPKVSAFRFPKDENMKNKWILAIRRKDFTVTKHTSVCQLHFKESDFETEASAYDSKTGRTITAPLSYKRLKPGVIPTLNIPPFKEADSPQTREDPEDKRMRIEEEHMSLALQKSLKNYLARRSTMPKQRNCHCFVPGCKTQYKNSNLSLFGVPKNKEMFDKWQILIPRADKLLHERSAICELHFKEEFIIRVFKHTINGETVTIPRTKPVLVPGAVPTLFPNHPKHFSAVLPKKRKHSEFDSSAEDVDTQISQTAATISLAMGSSLKSEIIRFCNGNSKRGPKVSMFSFPKDPEINQKWVDAIQRPEFVPSKHSKVCEKHFDGYDIERESKMVDPVTGKLVCAKLDIPRLRKGAIPTKIPEAPSIVSRDSSHRLSPGQKKNSSENQQVEKTIAESLKCISGKTSRQGNGSDSESNSSTPTSRNSEDKIAENQKKKVTKKRKSDKEECSRKKNNSIGNSNSVQQSRSSDFQQASQSENIDDSTINLLNTSNSFEQVQIKDEPAWEEEYNFHENALKHNTEKNDMVKVASVEPILSSERQPGTSSQVEAGKSGPEGCDMLFYKKPFKMDQRDEAFGKFVACEISDLRSNPELYLKTQETISKLLIEAHFKLMSSTPS